MPDDAKPTLNPKLRFPEFRRSRAWHVSELAAIADLRKGDQLSASLKEDAAPYPHFNGGVSPSSRTREANRDANTTIISEGGNSCGHVQFVSEPFWCGGHCYSVHSKGRLLDRYLFHALEASQKHIMALRVGSGLPNIPRAVLGKFQLAVAEDEAEQQKIADCLTSLDEVIAAQGRKVEALAAHKKGLMQQLFPREGETLPRLRFPEFRDAGEWKEQRLDDIADFQSGGTPSKANPEFWNGSIPWVSAKDMKHLVLNDTQDHISQAAVEDGARVVPAGTVLMLTRGMTLMKDVPICLLSRPMSLNQDVRALRPKNGFDGRFLAYLLMGNKQRLRSMVDIAGHGTGRLNTDRVKTFDLLFPKPPEQQRIADCLGSLAVRLAAEAEKLAALKTHKKGLMQLLFP